MSKPWPKVSLGELLRLERRPVKVEPQGRYQEIGIYCFGRGIFHKSPRTGFEVGDKALFLMKEGDFILQVTFAWEGAVAVVSAAEDGMYGSTRYPTFRVDERRCVPQFLRRYFSTQEGLQQLVKICPGSAGRNRVLSTKRIPEVLVPLPSVAEQRSIVERVEAIAGKVDEARRLRGEAEEEAAVLWERSAAKVCDRAVENAPLRPLADIVEVRGGGTPSKSNPFFWEGRIPWVSPKDMKLREIHDSIDHISEAATRETAAKLLEPGAVLIVVRGMILAHTVPSAVLRVPAAINQDMKALIAGPDVLPEYLSALFWAYNQRLLGLVEKSTHDTRKLQTAKLLDTKVPVPPIEQQRRIIDDLLDLDVKVRELVQHQSSSGIAVDAVMPAVLDKAFRGET
jgi:type I restriction enzyme S subunit